MRIIKGQAGSSGVAVGKVCVFEDVAEASIPFYHVQHDSTEYEILRTAQSLDSFADELARLIVAARKAGDNGAAEIFQAHELVLRDPALRETAADIIITELVNAEYAINRVFASYIANYRSKGGHFFELSHDLEDIRIRVLQFFGHDKSKFICDKNESSCIAVARLPMPSSILGDHSNRMKAMITQEGSPTAHGVIIAKTKRVPLVYGIDIKEFFSLSCLVVVDGTEGLVIVDPDAETLEKYRKMLEKEEATQHWLSEDCLPLTKDGSKVELLFNIASYDDLDAFFPDGAGGIGLLRTEFIFFGTNIPSLEQHLSILKKASYFTKGKKVCVRLLDLGADKAPPYMKIPRMIDHDLGLRGSRAVNMFRRIYLDQIRGIVRARHEGHDIRVIYPMICDYSDILVFRSLLREAMELENMQISVPEGIMIETPSAAIMARELLDMVDFGNLGTNDLMQYCLAAARNDPVASTQYHTLHPALLRMMQMAIKGAKKARKKLHLCGILASVPQYYPVLLAMGLDSFSVQSNIYGPTCHALSNYPLSGDKRLLNKLYKSQSKEETKKLVDLVS